MTSLMLLNSVAFFAGEYCFRRYEREVSASGWWRVAGFASHIASGVLGVVLIVMLCRG